jgi:hypothetical protein
VVADVSDPSVTVRAFEEVEAEMRRVAALIVDTFGEYDRTLEQAREHGMTLGMTIPPPLAGAYQQYRQRVDLKPVTVR